jgi:MFS superfamily sulfate permease-like transporter
LAIGASCLAVILIFKRRWPKIPGVLVAVIGATIVVSIFDLATAAVAGRRGGPRVVGIRS